MKATHLKNILSKKSCPKKNCRVVPLGDLVDILVLAYKLNPNPLNIMKWINVWNVVIIGFHGKTTFEGVKLIFIEVDNNQPT